MFISRYELSATGAKKAHDSIHHIALAHDHGMRRFHDTMSSHALESRTLDRDFSIVLSGNEAGQDQIDAASAEEIEKTRKEIFEAISGNFEGESASSPILMDEE